MTDPVTPESMEELVEAVMALKPLNLQSPLLLAISTECGIPPAKLDEVVMGMDPASAGAAAAAQSAWTLGRQLNEDIMDGQAAKWGVDDHGNPKPPFGQPHPAFRDYTSPEGNTRRKVYRECRDAVMRGMKEIRAHLQKAVWFQIQAAEGDMQRARNAGLDPDGADDDDDESTPQGLMANLSAAVADARPKDTKLKRTLRRKGREKVKVEYDKLAKKAEEVFGE